MALRFGGTRGLKEVEHIMGALLLVLLLALILGGVGFAVHILWWVALVVLVLWVAGFFFRGAGESRGRWYRW
jgi:low temperature requirement protein LtrA